MRQTTLTDFGIARTPPKIVGNVGEVGEMKVQAKKEKVLVEGESMVAPGGLFRPPKGVAGAGGIVIHAGPGSTVIVEAAAAGQEPQQKKRRVEESRKCFSYLEKYYVVKAVLGGESMQHVANRRKISDQLSAENDCGPCGSTEVREQGAARRGPVCGSPNPKCSELPQDEKRVRPGFNHFPINTSHFSFGFLCEP